MAPGGSKRIIRVGDYVDNSFTALGGSDPREVRLKAFMFFIFDLFKSIFLLLNFITLFQCLTKYYHIMFITLSLRG